MFDRIAAQPLFMCSFRPFFLAAASYASALMLLWLAFLTLGIGVPHVPGGAVVWHAHELIVGFGGAAIAGFVLTAVPEFTASAAFSRRRALGLSLLWLAARVAYWLSGTFGSIGAALAAVLDLAFVGALIAAVLPRLWQDGERRHLSFAWALAALWLVMAGFHVDVLRGAWPMRWLLAAVGVMMVLIVVALSRISMRIVNDAVQAASRRLAEHAKANGHTEDAAHAAAEATTYRARPPRRNLLIFAITIFTIVHFLLPASPIGGWLALAASAAAFNLLNDWHIGRAAFSRWSLLLYATYWLLALGYALTGAALLGAPLASSAGLHLLTAGAMGVSIFGVLCIAGRTHAGLELDPRPWVAVAGGALVAGALTRAAAGVAGLPGASLMALAAALWVLGYTLAAAYLGSIFIRARSDGGSGCEEAMELAQAG